MQATQRAVTAITRGPRVTFAGSSTDSNLAMSLGIPAVTIGGGGEGGNWHSRNEWYRPVDAWLRPAKRVADNSDADGARRRDQADAGGAAKEVGPTERATGLPPSRERNNRIEVPFAAVSLEVGTKRTSSDVRSSVANGGKPTWRLRAPTSDFDPQLRHRQSPSSVLV